MKKKTPLRDPSSSDRREFLKLSALVTAAGALSLLGRYERAVAAEPDAPLRIGYLPITDATPLLVAHHNRLFQDQGLAVDRPRLFRSWAQIVEAFLAGQVNAVHLLAPMTVWARYGSGARAKVVAWNHMSGSGLTVQPDVRALADLGGKTVAIPAWYSIHNVVLQHLLRREGLAAISEGTPGPREVKLVVMAPSDMVPALATGQIAGYIVAEPFNAAAEVLGVGRILRFTGDVWRDHACCVVLMHERDLDRRPEWAQKVVNGVVRAQVWIRDHREEAARILARDNPQRYTPHAYDTLARVLAPAREQAAAYAETGAIRHPEWNDERIAFQPYPFPSYFEALVALLKKTHVSGRNEFLRKLDPKFVARDLVDDRFVKRAIADVGGMRIFDLPERYTREEMIVT
ncbi:MAG TPA: ABC transporter substrate-binding protein [Burkholderiales bacterium]